LSKSNRDVGIAALRADGVSPEEAIGRAAAAVGLIEMPMAVASSDVARLVGGYGIRGQGSGGKAQGTSGVRSQACRPSSTSSSAASASSSPTASPHIAPTALTSSSRPRSNSRST